MAEKFGLGAHFMYDIIAQVLGIAGMTMNIFSYQGKQQRSVILMQLVGAAFFTANMFMLGAWSGFILNALGIARAIVYANKEKFQNLKFWNTLFFISYALSYIAVFTVFQKPVTVLNLLIEMLPTSAMAVSTVAFSRQNASDIRKFAWYVSPAWLVYDAINLSIGGTICETISLISIITATLRLDRKKAK